MATITTSLSFNALTNLPEGLSAFDVTTATDTSVALHLSYVENAPADQIILTGTGLTVTNGMLTGGTISGIEFKLAGASVAAVSDLALNSGAVNDLLGSNKNFEHYLEHLDHAAAAGTGAPQGTSGEALFGGQGDDTETGTGGDDFISAGSGNDTVDGGAGNDDIAGDAGDDNLNGGAGNDVLAGGEGDDNLAGGAGDDTIDGGAGSHDVVHYEGTAAVNVDLTTGVATGQGHDTLTGIEDVVGSDKADVVVGNDSNNTLSGGAGNDSLSGGLGDDVLDGGDGKDNLAGGQGDDQLDGGAGNDQLAGGAGNNTLAGGAGNDKISAEGGDDVVDGGTGDDVITAGDGANVVDGGEGNDKITSGSGADTINGGIGADKISSGDGNDTDNGGAGDDSIVAGAGDDVLNGGTGADKMAGGTGNDTYYVDNAGDKVSEKGGEGTDTVISSVSYSLEKDKAVENLTLAENAVPNNIDATGNGEDNILIGNSGDNVLNGKSGADTLTGGAGHDTFVFDNMAKHGADTVTDFHSGEDTLQLSAKVFSALNGAVTADNLVMGSAAHDANDHLIFDQATGHLYYDADGTGGKEQVLLATLTGVTELHTTDFSLV